MVRYQTNQSSIPRLVFSTSHQWRRPSWTLEWISVLSKMALHCLFQSQSKYVLLAVSGTAFGVMYYGSWTIIKLSVWFTIWRNIICLHNVYSIQGDSRASWKSCKKHKNIMWQDKRQAEGHSEPVCPGLEKGKKWTFRGSRPQCPRYGEIICTHVAALNRLVGDRHLPEKYMCIITYV